MFKYTVELGKHKKFPRGSVLIGYCAKPDKSALLEFLSRWHRLEQVESVLFEPVGFTFPHDYKRLF